MHLCLASFICRPDGRAGAISLRSLAEVYALICVLFASVHTLKKKYAASPWAMGRVEARMHTLHTLHTFFMKEEEGINHQAAPLVWTTHREISASRLLGQVRKSMQSMQVCRRPRPPAGVG